MSNTKRNIPFKFDYEHNEYVPIKVLKEPRTLNEHKIHSMAVDMMLEYGVTPSNRERQKANDVKAPAWDNQVLSCYGELKTIKAELDKLV